MAATIHELKGSFDFRDGPNGYTAEGRYMIVGGSTIDAAYTLVKATAPTTATAPNGTLVRRGEIDVKDSGGGVFKGVVEYASSIRSDAGTDWQGNPSGSDPGPQSGGMEGGGDPAGGVPASQEIGSEFSFTTGGGTTRIFTSKETLQSFGRTLPGGGVEEAPDMKKLIGLPLGGGEIQGCEVYSPRMEFSVSQQFTKLSVGYILRLMATTAKTNKKPFRGCARGEVLFLGADGHFKSGDTPWQIAGRFGYSRNQIPEPFGDIHFEIPIPGWAYIWFQFQTNTQEINVPGIGVRKVMVQEPVFCFVERVYDEEDFVVLSMDFKDF